jgi:hypothetical protein
LRYGSNDTERARARCPARVSIGSSLTFYLGLKLRPVIYLPTEEYPAVSGRGPSIFPSVTTANQHTITLTDQQWALSNAEKDFRPVRPEHVTLNE